MHVADSCPGFLLSIQVHLPRTTEAETLAAELLNYEIRGDENANDRYGAFRVGTHDDLVTALGLAVQLDFGPTSKLIDERIWSLAPRWAGSRNCQQVSSRRFWSAA